mgnify:CR=1 FL=1
MFHHGHAAGGRAERSFELTTAIYKLEAFKVTGEREGDAAALTSQRNSENLKNVVAIAAGAAACRCFAI